MMTSPFYDHFPKYPKIIYMGTPDFAVPSLKALVDHGHTIQSVVTQPDRPKGRGKKSTPSPVKEFAIENGIEVLQPERVSAEAFCQIIQEKSPDLIIVTAFGQLLPGRLLSIPKWGAINIHASLLPKYRGAAPIQWAVLNNEPLSGLSVMHLDEGMDTGPILLQEELKIMENETGGSLQDRLARQAGPVIIRTLARMIEGTISERPQDHTAASYAPKIDRSMGLIDWARDATQISGLIRALDPKPGAYTIMGDKEIKLFSPVVHSNDKSNPVPGRVLGDAKTGMMIETGKGTLEIKDIQYPGKKRMSVQDFLRGFSIPPETILGHL